MKEEIKKNNLNNVVSSEYIYKGRILNLRVDQVKFPSGDVHPREVIEHRDAVAVLPVDYDGNIYLISSYRHPVAQDLYEIPAGLIDDGETPYDAAVRELREEIGYRPDSLDKISSVYSSPGFSTEIIHLFIAGDLVKDSLPQDEDEYIEVAKFTPNEVRKLVSQGKIKDGKTMMSLYWYFWYFGGCI